MKRILLFLVSVLTLNLTVRGADGDEFTADNLKFKVLSEEEHTVKLIGYEAKPSGDLTIPSEVSNGISVYAVTSLGQLAFYNCTSLNAVIIPNSVIEIGNGTFSCCTALGSVVIPNSVTIIGNSPFQSCNGLTSVTIPKSVTQIGVSPFGGCLSLKEILVEEGNPNYMSIDGVLFNKDKTVLLQCPATKKSYDIQNFVTQVAEGAFLSCSSLTSVTIPGSVTKIGENAFTECSSLPSVTIPGSVTEISGGVFKDCSSLTSITIPNSVTKIGYYAFYNCTSLESVIIPHSVTTIELEAFFGCSSLVSVTLPDSTTVVADGTFQNCTSLKSIILPSSVTTIGHRAFLGCKSLPSVTLGSSVTKIGWNAFEYCSSMKTIVSLSITPPSLQNYNVFDGCPTDATVYIPKGTIDKYSVADGWARFTDFREMGTLEIKLSESSLTLKKGTSAPITASVTKDDDISIESETWATSNPEVATVEDGVVTAIGKGKATITFTVVDNYGVSHSETLDLTVRGADGDEFTADNLKFKVLSEEEHTVEVIGKESSIPRYLTIPSEVTDGTSRYTVVSIGDGALEGSFSLTSVTIPNSVTTIGDQAFARCSSLTTVTIPNLVTTIGQYAFSFCSSLTSVNLGSSVTTIGDGAFGNCSSLASINLGSSVTTIGESAFGSCSSLTSITIPNSVTEIARCTFYGCNSLASVTIPNSVREIGIQAFDRCRSLTSVAIPNSVTTIGHSAFAYCGGLTTVTIPNSVTQIGSGPFAGCILLEEILVEDGNPNYTSMEGVLFTKDKTTLLQCPGKKESYVIPNSVTEIGTSAFMACNFLKSVTIPNSVKIIGNMAFNSCRALTSVTLPNSVTEIAMAAFVYCSSLTSVTIPNSVTAIGSNAFQSCTSLTSITIPNSVTAIGSNAFSFCSSLTSVSIPDSLTVIPGGLFRECPSLTSITIPAAVTEIGQFAFLSCSSLRTIVSLPTTPPSLDNYNPFDECPADAVVYIPKGTLDGYSVADGWTLFSDFREMGALEIRLSESSLTLEEGASAAITASVTKDDDISIESETWATSNSEVATVQDGVVTAISEGNASITFTVVDNYGVQHSESCEIEVSAASGIEGIEADGSDAPAEYYNLNGVRVANPERGLYIKLQGGKAAKVLVK